MATVGRKVEEVCEIADIMGRTDSVRKVGGGEEALSSLREAYSQLQEEKEKAADYFARKRVEDIRDLEANVARFEGDLGDLRTNFSANGPFTLSWKSHEALAELDLVLGKTAELRGRERAILQEAAALEIERKPSAALVGFESRVRKVYVIWEVEGEWEDFQKNLLSKSASSAGEGRESRGANIEIDTNSYVSISVGYSLDLKNAMICLCSRRRRRRGRRAP